MTKVCGWDENGPFEREATEEEKAEIASRASEDSKVKTNAAILAQLEVIDAKSIRALREGDVARIAAWNEQAAELRAQLVKG